MKRALTYLSSVHFALFLLIVLAFFTAVATIIEANNSSNALAKELIFSTFFYRALLAGFFINILAALIKRTVERKGSWSFTSAHIGLLMVIASVALKELYGFQGYLLIKEGEKKDFAFVEESYGLSYRYKGTTTWQSIPLGKGSQAIGDITLHLDSYFPHGSETYHPFLSRDQLHIQGLPPLPFNTRGSALIQERTWQYSACKKEEMASWLSTLTPPFLLFVEEEEENLAVAVDKEVAWNYFPKKKIDCLYLYEEGFQGYTLPFSFFGEEIESPLIIERKPENRLNKREDERPLIRLSATQRERQDQHSLLFSKLGEGLATPFLEGTLIIKFEPLRRKLPHEIRLRLAETEYPEGGGRGRPIAYRAYLWVDEEPVMLSMNEVFESKEGLRYFLASISPQDETDVKTVKLIVNYDPYKYWLTYPGALLIFLGALLLFFGKKFSKN